MPLDPSIPLSGNNPQFNITSLAEMMQIGKKMKAENAMKSILGNPQNMDPTTGLPNAQAIQQIMTVDPTAGLNLMKTSADLQQQIQQGKQQKAKLYAPMLKDTKDALANILQPDIEKFGLEKAVEMHRGDYAEAIKSLGAQGVDREFLASMPQELNPQVANMLVAQAVSPEKRADLAEKDAAGKRAEAALGEKEAHDRATEKATADRAAAAAEVGKFTPYQEADTKDEKGNAVPGRVLSFDSKSGKYYDADGKQTAPGKISKVGSGGPGPVPRSGSAIAVKKFMEENPNATAADIQKFMAKGTALSAAQRSLEAGPIGLQLKSLGVATDHLTTLRDLNEAFKGGDEKTIARAKAAWQTEFGTPAPSNMEVAAQFVAPELIKAIEGTPGGVAERDELAAKFKGARGQANVDGAIDTAFALMGGQLNGVRQQVVHVNKMMSDEEFDDMLPTAARDAMAKHATKSGKQTATSGPSGPATKHAVGDLIVQGGKRYRATAVDKDGKVTAAEEVQ